MRNTKLSVFFLFLLTITLPVLVIRNGGVFAVSSVPVTPPTPPTTITPTVTPTATPTPTVKPNRPPVITTNFLPMAKINRPYRAYVTGFDFDVDDTLTMKIANLPWGISQRECKQYPSFGRKMINCLVSGTPRNTGLYFVTATLTDNRGGKTTKTIPLLIRR